MDQIDIAKAQLKMRVLEATDPSVPKPCLYAQSEKIEALAGIEDKADRERQITNIIKEINKNKMEEGKRG